jgi:hypothetical protein
VCSGRVNSGDFENCCAGNFENCRQTNLLASHGIYLVRIKPPDGVRAGISEA